MNLENLIKSAQEAGVLVDKRGAMPKGPAAWPKRKPSDILGVCIHQNGTSNKTDPRATAIYHTSEGNHITSAGTALPSICYDFAIPALNEPAWLVSNILDRKYAQGSRNSPGDENTALISIVVMGKFKAPSVHAGDDTPSVKQYDNLDVLCNWLQHVFKFPNLGFFGHFDFGKASCPGWWGIEYIETKRAKPDTDMFGEEIVTRLLTDEAWQWALLTENKNCLPYYGPDGIWGNESRRALSIFQKRHNLEVNGMQDIFTELKLLKMIERTPSDSN